MMSPAQRFWRGFRALTLLVGLMVLGTFAQWGLRPKPEWRGVAEVIDGDSLRIQGQELRLKGIDAPEYRQFCQDARGQEYACGRLARQALAAILGHEAPICTEHGKDRYNRALVTCRVKDQDIGARLVREGMAVAYGDYESEEAEARRAHAGLWAGNFEMPQDWRRRHPRDP